MIKSFCSYETKRLFAYRRSKRFRHIERVALRKLLQLHAATELWVLASPRATGWKHCGGIDLANIRFALMISGDFVLSGAMAMLTKSKSWIITSRRRS